MRNTARLSCALAIGVAMQIAGAATAQQGQPLPVPGPFQVIGQPQSGPQSAPQPAIGVLPNRGSIPALPYWMQVQPRAIPTPLGGITPTIFPNVAPQFAPAATRSQGVLNTQGRLAVSGGAGAQFQAGGNYRNNGGGNGWGGNGWGGYRPGFGFAPAPGYFPGYAPGYGAAPQAANRNPQLAPAPGYGPNTPAPFYGNAPWGAPGFNPFNGPWGGNGYPQQFPQQYPQQFPQRYPPQYPQPYQPQR